jgi:hypothetical protein
MSLGKNAVIGGKLEPDGVRSDCDFVDAGWRVVRPRSGSVLGVLDGERISSELLNCEFICWPARPRLSNELKVELELLFSSGRLAPGLALACREASALLERALGASDCLFAARAFSFNILSRSFNASGTPSHLVLTLGTC